MVEKKNSRRHVNAILSSSGKKLVETATERSKQLISTKEMQSFLDISACYLEFPANSY